MAIPSSDNKFAEQTRQGLAHLKNITESLEGWEFTQEQEKVKLYTKKGTDASLPPLVRGDAVLIDVPAGCTPYEVATVATLPGCRKIWDDKFDRNEIKEHYARGELFFWVKIKTPWPVSARDFVGTVIRDNEPDVCYTSMKSMVDARYPDVSGCVRGTLHVSGWKISQTQDNKIAITCVNQIDLAGSLPTSFLKKTLQQIPMVAGHVRDYINQYGFVPSLNLVSDKVAVKDENFDHDKRTYKLDLSGSDSGEVAIFTCSSKMFPKGVSVSVTGGNADIQQDQDANKNYRVYVKNLRGSDNVQITIAKKK